MGLSNGHLRLLSLKKSSQIDLISASVCCTLFATIDFLAFTILHSTLGTEDTLGTEEVKKPVYSAMRIGASAMGAVMALNVWCSNMKLPIAERETAIAVILTAVVIYNLINSNLGQLNLRY